MKINNNNLIYKKINFTSTARISSNKIGNSNILNTSWMFRDDIDWYWLANYMNISFKDKDKVNVLNCACSDGSETYSLAIAINETMPLKEKRNKFLPIIASDIDKNIIQFAKSGKINLTQNDIKTIAYLSKDYMQNYFLNPNFSLDINNDPLSNACDSYEINPYLKYATCFKQSDIITELSKLKDEGNSVVLFRNVTPYLNSSYLEKLIAMFREQLKPNSLAVFGNYDQLTSIKDTLLDTFVEVNQNILKKIK